jgi:ABC-type multidrug transport system fused ATPase/permease subunit
MEFFKILLILVSKYKDKIGFLMHSLKNLLHFVGRKVAFYFLLNTLFSIGLSCIELLISIFLQAFLVSLGFLNQKISLFGIIIPTLQVNLVILFLFFIGLFRFIFQLITMQSASFANEMLNARLRCLCLRDLFSKDLSNSKDISQINYQLSEIFPKASLFILNLTQFSSFLFQAKSLIFIMFLTLWKECLLSLFGIFFIAIIILFVNKIIRNISHNVPTQYANITALIERVFKNFTYINIMRIKNYEYKNMIENLLNYEFKSIRIIFLSNLSSTIAPFLGIILLIAVITISHNVWHSSSVQLIAFLYLLIRFIQNLSTLASTFGMLNIYIPQYKLAQNYFQSFSFKKKERVFQIVNELNFIGKKLNKKYDHVSFEANFSENYSNLDKKIIPKITLKNILFYYQDPDKKILDHLSLIISKGSQFAIIGPSGSGKTTLLMLLLGLLKPTSGEISIENLSPEEFLNNHNNKVGYVGVEPFLIKGTIKENLLFGIKETPTEEELWESLKQVSLLEHVKQIGLDYMIQEDHSGLSAGQKQRLCLARAFLNKPTLLILDEATANLDEKTESEIALATLAIKGKCTTIIVSHRKGMIKYADEILELTSIAHPNKNEGMEK